MRKLALLILFFLLFATHAAVAEDIGHEVLFEDFSAGSGEKPQILYTGKTKISLTMRSKPDKNSEGLGVLGERKRVQIWGYNLQWLFCWDDEVGIYYLRRSHSVDEIEPVNPENTQPYGVIKQNFVAVTAEDAILYSSPDPNSEVIEQYPADTRMSVWVIQDGWALIPYKRVLGYMYVGSLKELTPVAPDVNAAEDGDILATYTTFYSMKQTELNIGRMENLRVGCMYMEKTFEPGEECSFNATAGPYRAARGYKPSPVLIDGGTVAGYGGGTCQVSTTLYNAILQIPDTISVLYRRPHGPGGASYAPHGVDAAVGTDYLDLRFSNIADFPVYLESSVQNGAICICIRKGVHPDEA